MAKKKIATPADGGITAEADVAGEKLNADPTQVETVAEPTVNGLAPPGENQSEAPNGKSNEKTKRVRVICDGTLGPKLLEKGDITDDPDYVALLEIKGQKKVEAVK
ncbi:MAG: hypothetical protein IPM50_09245 [Acidobacteriota bacterium]|nr:MAG: hypothetical protein IPM50_09245 [Acidobacteriota bacterium]